MMCKMCKVDRTVASCGPWHAEAHVKMCAVQPFDSNYVLVKFCVHVEFEHDDYDESGVLTLGSPWCETLDEVEASASSLAEVTLVAHDRRLDEEEPMLCRFPTTALKEITRNAVESAKTGLRGEAAVLAQKS